MPRKKRDEDPSDLTEAGLRYTRETFDQLMNQTEDYVRANPTQSLFYAFIAGFILNRLPVGRILSGVLRLAMFALKPAILVYGATKLYQAIDEENR
jgi:hypothetical protein